MVRHGPGAQAHGVADRETRRGRGGTIEFMHGAHVFADSHALGLGEQPCWLYTVVFEGQELWGPDASAGLRVSVDAWEPYLEAAP